MARISPQLPTVGKYAMLKRAQEATLAQHKAFAAGLEQKKAETQTRQTDLDVADRVMKVLDSRIPKSARQFLNTQLAQYVGVDPKNESFKGMSSAILGLDPQSSQILRAQFAQGLEGAQPGQIVEMTRGLMTGQVPLNSFLDQVDFTGATGQEELAGGEGQDQLNTTTIQKQPKAAQPFQGGPGSVQSFEGQRTVPAAAQQASPMLVGALGFDSRTRLRNNDLFQQGYRIPMDPKDQEKLAESITTRATGLSSTVSEAANMVDLFRGKPETLGPVGDVTRAISAAVQQAQGFFNVVKPGTVVEGPDELTQDAARKVGLNILKTHGIDATAESSARIQSMVLGLAYRMAVANDIPGNRLTNGIIQQNLAQLGQSASPNQFEAVLKDTIASTAREFNEHMRRTVGVDGLPVMARYLSNSDIKRMGAAGTLVPKEMRDAIRTEASNRLTGAGQPTLTPASPTLEEEERTLGGLETQNKERQIAGREQEMDLAQKRDQRAAAAESRAENREERVAGAQEKSQQLQERQFTYMQEENARDNARADAAAQRSEQREERVAAAQVQSQQLAREQFDYRKMRDREEDERENRKHITNAFLQFGKAIAELGGGGAAVGGLSVPNLGAQQDSSAFRITPGPQRQAPQPARGG